MPLAQDPPLHLRDALISLGLADAAIERLGGFVADLDQWRQRINLIGPATVDQIWQRHILDSAQAWPYLDDPAAPLLDLGSGSGLPGLVLAILGASDVTLVDSDQRKAVFLREAARKAGVTPRVVAKRFEAALAQEGRRYHIVTGRAVAPLARLAPIIANALLPSGYALLHKGARVESELTDVQKSWSMQHTLIPSITASDGVLVKIWGLQRRDQST